MTEKTQDLNEKSGYHAETGIEDLSGELATVESPEVALAKRQKLIWIGFIATLVILALITIYAAIRGVAHLTEEQLSERSAIRLIIEGRPHDLAEAEVVQLFPEIQTALEQSQGDAIAQVEADIDRRVDAAFAPSLRYVSSFANWYYSLQGEYSRYAAALGGDLNRYLRNQFHKQVLQAGNLEGLVGQLSVETDKAVAAEIRSGVGAVSNRMAAFVQTRGIPESPDYRIRVDETINLGSTIQQGLRITKEDVARQASAALLGVGAGAGAAKGLGALAAKNAVAKVAGTKGFKAAVALLAKFVAKSAAKSGGAGAAAAVGAAYCSPGGLVAIGCGAIGGLATWLLVDKAFIAFDEALNREEFEIDLSHGLLLQRNALKQELKTAYRKVITTHFGEVASQFQVIQTETIGQDFVPAKELHQ